jgi:hypothetical protein
MKGDDRSPDDVNAAATTEADVEELCQRAAQETALAGSSPHLVIAGFAEEHLRFDLARQREEQERRHEDDIGSAGPEHWPMLLREQARERQRLEYRLSLQVRELAAATEHIYWSERLHDRPDGVQHIPEATRELQDKHRAEDEALAQLHDKDLQWLHGEPNIRHMLSWMAGGSPRAINAALACLRQLHQRELDALKARHEHDIRVRALVLEHEEDRAAALRAESERLSPDPQKAELTDHPPRSGRNHKPDLDFER